MALTHTIPRVGDAHTHRLPCISICVGVCVRACARMSKWPLSSRGSMRDWRLLVLIQNKGLSIVCEIKWKCGMYWGTFFSVASSFEAVVCLFFFLHRFYCEIDLLIAVLLVSKGTMQKRTSRTWITFLEKPFRTKRVRPHLCPWSIHVSCVFDFKCLCYRC